MWNIKFSNLILSRKEENSPLYDYVCLKTARKTLSVLDVFFYYKDKLVTDSVFNVSECMFFSYFHLFECHTIQ